MDLPPAGTTRYGAVDYSGTIYVKDSEGSDYLGVVFGYQSNRKFYVVMWRRENINFGSADTNTGIKGLQLKVRIKVLIIDCEQVITRCDQFTIYPRDPRVLS